MRIRNILAAAVLATGIWAGNFASADEPLQAAAKPAVTAVKERRRLIRHQPSGGAIQRVSWFSLPCLKGSTPTACPMKR